MKFAIIDLGSNSARMTMAEVIDKKAEELFERRTMVRLSEGMDSDGCLKEEPMRRTIAVLKEFKKEITAADAKVLAVATAAVRNAKNGGIFSARVKEETGIELRILSGKEEAWLDSVGVTAAFPEEREFLISDIGGGSTEIILIRDKKIEEKISIPFGAMVLTDRYLRDEGGYIKAEEEVIKTFNEIEFLNKAKGLPIIAMGGSAGALYGIGGKLGLGKGEKINGYTFFREEIRRLKDEIFSRSKEERIKDFDMEEGRADNITGGIIPLYLLAEKISAPSVKICTAGLRQGIISLLPEYLP